MLLDWIVIILFLLAPIAEPSKVSNETSSYQDILLSLLNNPIMANGFEAKEKEKLSLFPKNYDKREAPPAERNEVRDIDIMMTIESIPLLDEIKEVIQLEMRITHTWADERLNVSGIKGQVELEPSFIHHFWTPDSYFASAVKSDKVEMMQPPASLTVYENARVKYQHIQIISLYCPMSFEAYPFDTQVCDIKLMSFGYNSSFNIYTWEELPLLKMHYLDNHEVHMDPYNVSSLEENMTFPGVGIKLSMRRKLTYHLTQTYIPSVMFIIVAWISFFVPSDVVPGRMALCITTILTFTTMFNSVRSLTPQVAYMKAIDIWILCCLLFVFSTLAEYGIILHLTTRAGWQKRVDNQIRSQTGESRLSKLSFSERLNTNSNTEYPDSHPDYRNERNTTRININPKEAEIGPKRRERLAYNIEHCSKIVYPVCFIIFCIIYWSYFLSYY